MATSSTIGQPPDPKEVLKELTKQILWLDTKWKVFQILYRGDQSLIEEMNRRTGFLFYLFQDGLVDDVMLRISRLLDKAGFGRRNNITFDLAVRGLPPHVDPALRATLTSRIACLRALCDDVILHRNRRIGHVDMGAALSLEPLPPVKWMEVRQAVEEAKRLVSEISIAHDGTEIGYVNWGDEKRAVDILIRVLRLGNDAIDAERKARRDRLKALTGDDVDPPDDPLKESPW
jgi:hypothetical protein